MIPPHFAHTSGGKIAGRRRRKESEATERLGDRSRWGEANVTEG